MLGKTNIKLYDIFIAQNFKTQNGNLPIKFVSRTNSYTHEFILFIEAVEESCFFFVFFFRDKLRSQISR